jgi:hypothetical protein
MEVRRVQQILQLDQAKLARDEPAPSDPAFGKIVAEAGLCGVYA